MTLTNSCPLCGIVKVLGIDHLIIFAIPEEVNRITDEILHYPPPIPACDVQFNHLLAQRSQIHQELNRLKEIVAQSEDQSDELQEFVDTSEFVSLFVEVE